MRPPSVHNIESPITYIVRPPADIMRPPIAMSPRALDWIHTKFD